MWQVWEKQHAAWATETRAKRQAIEKTMKTIGFMVAVCDLEVVGVVLFKAKILSSGIEEKV